MRRFRPEGCRRAHEAVTRCGGVPWRVALLLPALAIGCASTAPYGRLAQAGSAYAAALDQLAVVAGRATVDATSERLLQDDELHGIDLATYKKFAAEDEHRLAVLARLRTHAGLLRRYFDLLDELVQSKAPAQTAQAIGGVADALATLGSELRASPILADHETVTGVSELALGVEVRGALRREFERRGAAIDRELATQQELLVTLGSTVAHDLAIIKEIREERLVIAPLLAKGGVSSADRWITTRRDVFLGAGAASEFDTAADAARELREAFADLAAGHAARDQLAVTLRDLDAVSAVLTTVASGAGGGQ
jgi:hypothetical protein